MATSHSSSETISCDLQGLRVARKMSLAILRIRTTVRGRGHRNLLIVASIGEQLELKIEPSRAEDCRFDTIASRPALSSFLHCVLLVNIYV